MAKQVQKNRRNLRLALKMVAISSVFLSLTLSWVVNDKFESTLTTFIERLAYAINSSATPVLFFLTNREARERLRRLAMFVFRIKPATVVPIVNGTVAGNNNAGAVTLMMREM